MLLLNLKAQGLLLGVLLALIQGGFGQQSNCSDSSTLQQCLQSIKTTFQDTSRFFFGSSFIAKCPPEKAITIECLNTRGTRNNSMASILFKPGTFDPNTLDRTLNVTFYSPPGNYSACDTVFSQKSPYMFSLDPSSNKTHKPWDVRLTPNVTYTADAGRYYTLIVQDVGSGFLHGVYINIPGNNMAKATVVKHYHGPRNSRNVTNPYAFMLFDQGTNLINITSSWRAIFATPVLQNFSASDFRDSYNMIGPVALNWALMNFDAYAVKLQKAMGIIENCAPFVAQALAKHDTPFLPTQPTFSIYMRVTFSNQYLDFTYCCQFYQYPARTFNIDPIGDKMQLAGETRTGNPVMLHVTMNKHFPTVNDFQGKMYTMLAVDPDVPYLTFGTKKNPLVHWIAYNGAVSTATSVIEFKDEVIAWRGPMPPNSEPHGYYFLLFEQTSGSISITNSTQYSDVACASSSAYGRCLFHVDRFATDNQLNLVSTSWFWSQNDHFVNMTRGVSEADSCPGKLPCMQPPVAGAPAGLGPIPGLLLIITMMATMIM